MESRWYLKPGQTLETTKIEDRGHALHITRNVWNDITAHLDRNRRIQEAVEKEKARKIALKEGSQQMAKNWEDSVENKRRRHEEERRVRLEQVAIDRMQNFLVLREEQKKIRKKYIEDARKTMYISQGHPRNLTGALIFSEVLHEREKQQELEKYIKQHEMEAEAKYAQQIKNAAEQEKSENLEKERQLMEKKLELRKIYLEEINEREQQNKENKETTISLEKEDQKNADLEYEKIQQNEREAEQEKRAQIKHEFQQFYIKQQKAKELAQNVEKEQDIVIDIYSKAKHKIHCLRMKREREMQLALQARREAASKGAVAKAKEKSEDEERIIRKAIEEREQEELDRLKAKEENRNRLIQDRQEDRRKFVEREEKRKFEEAELNKWLLLNRCKKESVVKEYEEDKKKKEWQRKLEYRKVLFEQMAEDEERRRIEKADNQGYDVAKFAEDDKKFFEYAEECLEYAKKRGRTTFPVERVILEYKKQNRLPIASSRACQDYGSANSNSSQKESSKSLQSSQNNKKPKHSTVYYTPAECNCFK